MAEPKYKHTLRYDITTLKPAGKVLDAFPELAAYPVFAEHGTGEGDKLLRFALFYADKGSALHEISDLERKKKEALRLAGMAESDPRTTGVLAWTNPAAVALVNMVIKLMHSRKYLRWLHGSEMYVQTCEMLSVRIEADQPPLSLPEPTDSNTPDTLPAAIKKAQKDFGLLNRPSEMAEDKKQRAYDTRNRNWDALGKQGDELDELEKELFYDDLELANAQKEQQLREQAQASQRAASQSFVRHSQNN